MAAKIGPSLFSLFLFFLLLILSFSSTARSQSPSTNERRLLLRIQQDWADPVLDSTWNTSSWPGVDFSADGFVINISLSNNYDPRLSRPIPASLCFLRNLTHLDLSYNNIPGEFPVALYNCSSLSYLDLSQNRFVGVVPADVDRLSPLLTHLDLSSNNFSGDVPPSIGRFPALRSLILNSNLFNGSFPKEIGNLSNLETLSLAYNPFAPIRVPADFGNLTKLTFLWMTSTNIVGEIPISLSNLTGLALLDLSMNSLTGQIPSGMWRIPKLEYLYLYINNLSGPIVIDGSIAPGLNEIDVSMNKINGSIPEEFGNLQYLSALFLYYNQLSGQIPASIGRLPSLTDLRLFGNSLTGVLPPELGKHSPLWNFEVWDNRISGEIPEGLCNGGELNSIVLFNNNMSGRISSSISKCSKLNNIQLYGNHFTGDVPAGLWSAVNLTIVILRDNSFSGGIPSSLPWNLTRLDISNNRFSGQIPSSAYNLLVFNARNNAFSGHLPTSMAGLPRLQTLALGGNAIGGRIPADVSVLRYLTGLDLSRNQLSGEIPSSIGDLVVLNSLDLSVNQLTGSIPSAMGVLRFSFLNLSSNSFTGEIPAALQSGAYDRSFLANPGLCAASGGVLLNVPACHRGGSGSSGLAYRLRILFFILGAAVLLMVTAFAAFVYRDQKKRRRSPGGYDDDLSRWKLTSFQAVDFTESCILRGIKEENAIGSGGAGQVYKVALGNRAGEVVAVKKIWNTKRLSNNLEKSFLAEVEILGSIRHKNIVSLLCCISSADSKLLVYEFMENQSLDKWLHGNRGPLDWPRRLDIAIGAARGLSYMHHQCSPPVTHRDIKSSNILLDPDFDARIADFGLARLLVNPGEPDTVSVIAGSIGYMAPECGYSRRLNEKVDVFSFGVVLLELTTGREASNDGTECNLAEWAWMQFQEGRNLSEVVDPTMGDDSPYTEDVTTVFKLGLLCTDTLPSRRPSMKEVLQMLLECNRPWAAGGKADRIRAPHLLSQIKSGSQLKESTIVDEVDDATISINVWGEEEERLQPLFIPRLLLQAAE
ncbi:receptor-like protein kinase HSL1 [Zingiber officinale]|uniref:Protein kinase domain-containing protein n=1 Tax=Zingiber officinale TaxID=94328 RepID=A0A8J5FTF7_ZINOF|nr:receptor-like protein kinase HSL1 [Zingiber officinale]KAG6494009.1 hypothetical protein ZIOFF_049025 [Zingiber officinale]